MNNPGLATLLVFQETVVVQVLAPTGMMHGLGDALIVPV
jgi:hypothetical protein